MYSAPNQMTETESQPKDATMEDVVAHLVSFTQVISTNMIELQKTVGRILSVTDTQSKEIIRLQNLVNELMSHEEKRSVTEEVEPMSENVVRNTDYLRDSREYEDLLKKMELRKAQLVNPENSQKKCEVKTARAQILECARQYASTAQYSEVD